MVVNSANENVAIVYLLDFMLDDLLKTIEQKPTLIFDPPHIIVYCGISHYNDRTAKLVADAVLKNEKPTFAALLSQNAP